MAYTQYLVMNNMNSKPYNDEEIDFSIIFNLIKRNKFLITSITAISTLLTYFYCIKATPLWSGSFSILVKEEENNLTNSSSLLPGALQFKKFDEQSQTQLLILKSPYVLKPVFKYVENYNKLNNIENKLTYIDWITNKLKVDFEEESKVLLVKYIDYDKEHIINVLKLISERYQNYSKQKRNLEVNKSIKYLKLQKQDIKKKALKSQKELNLHSIENGLGDIDGFTDLEGTSTFTPDNNFLQNQNLSSTIQNESIKNTKPASQRFSNQFKLLEQYETVYLDLSSKLKANSTTLQSLKLKINNLKESLKRPNEILLKYRELLRKARINNNLLNKIDNKLEFFKLEKFQSPDPWLIISVPSIDQKIVYPRKILFTSVGLAFSFFFITTLVFFKEKFADILYESNELDHLLNLEKIGDFTLEDFELNIKKMKNIIRNSSLVEASSKLAFIKYKTVLFNNLINQLIKEEKKISFIDNIDDENIINNFDKVIIIVELGKITRKDVQIINEYINIYKPKIAEYINIK